MLTLHLEPPMVKVLEVTPDYIKYNFMFVYIFSKFDLFLISEHNT